jgi:hypothetical protein
MAKPTPRIVNGECKRMLLRDLSSVFDVSAMEAFRPDGRGFEIPGARHPSRRGGFYWPLCGHGGRRRRVRNSQFRINYPSLHTIEAPVGKFHFFIGNSIFHIEGDKKCHFTKRIPLCPRKQMIDKVTIFVTLYKFNKTRWIERSP